MSIKEIRKSLNLTQQEVSKLTNIPLRTYKVYENDKSKIGTIKYDYILNKLREYSLIDEEHGILSINKIKEICSRVFKDYDVEYCFLFGSYAKGYASETSDIDLLISSSVQGMEYFGLFEKLRRALNKKIDVLDINQLVNNKELLNEILKDGIKIYEQSKN